MTYASPSVSGMGGSMCKTIVDWLQERHVKNRMDSVQLGKLQMVGHEANSCYHLKRANVSGAKLKSSQQSEMFGL